MITWSLIVAALGLCSAGALVVRTKSRSSHWGPERFWLLGMGSLLPAWLVAFLGLLGSSTGPVPESALIGPSSAVLVGVIVTDTAVRHLHKPGRDHRPVTYWLLGVAAILPGWAVTLFLLSGKAVTK